MLAIPLAPGPAIARPPAAPAPPVPALTRCSNPPTPGTPPPPSQAAIPPRRGPARGAQAAGESGRGWSSRVRATSASVGGGVGWNRTPSGATQAMVPGEHVAQPVRQAEHPLADGHRGQHRVHCVGAALGHPPAPAARAEPLAGEGQQAVQPAAVAPEARKAVGQDAAPEERPKLLLHEPGQTGAVRPVDRLAQERLQVLANDGVEYGVLGVSGPIRRRRKRHAPGYAARGATPMPKDGYRCRTRTLLARSRGVGRRRDRPSLRKLDGAKTAQVDLRLPPRALARDPGRQCREGGVTPCPRS